MAASIAPRAVATQPGMPALGYNPCAVNYREVCPRCARPVVVCYCAHVEPVATRTHVLMLQHPRERDVPIGTVRIARLALENAEVRVGLDFAADPRVRAAIADTARPAVLLYPGDGARDLGTDPPDGPVTLVVLDGTWTQAAKLLRRNPAIAALPCYRFAPAAPSEYRIRREPADHCVATIEALAQALALLERDPTIVPRLLRPFRAMVARQLEYAALNVNTRHRHAHRTRAPRPRPVPPAFLDHAPADVVVTYGEANDWPYDTPDAPPREIVHWRAVRVATGEAFDAVVRPGHPLAPSVPRHAELAREAFEAGESFARFAARWSAFVKPDDVVCTWGAYAGDVLASQGLALPTRLDLKPHLAQFTGGRVGALEESARAVGWSGEPDGPGRAGRRIAALTAVAARLLREAEARRASAKGVPSTDEIP